MAEKRNNGLRNFICGAVVGVSLGVLFAPSSGKETRKCLKNRFDEVMDNLKNIDKEDVRRYFEDKITEIKKDLEELDGEKVLSVVKSKTKQIEKKLDELIKNAKDKATPVIEKSIESLRVKTIEVLNKTIEKLENKEN